jgi:ATP-dependent DNA helicase MPH1
MSSVRRAELSQPYVLKLVDKDVLNDRDLNISRLKPFRLTVKKMELKKGGNSGLMWCFGTLTSLEKMARAMGNLVGHMFNTLGKC